jgi:hypothetical protein
MQGCPRTVPTPNANSIKVEGLVAPNLSSNYAEFRGIVDDTCVLGPIYLNSVVQRYSGSSAD